MNESYLHEPIFDVHMDDEFYYVTEIKSFMDFDSSDVENLQAMRELKVGLENKRIQQFKERASH